MTNPSSLARRDHRGLFARLILRASLLSCGAKNVADYGAHQRKNDRRRLVEDFLTRAFGIDEVENRRNMNSARSPTKTASAIRILRVSRSVSVGVLQMTNPEKMITATRGMSPR